MHLYLGAGLIELAKQDATVTWYRPVQTEYASMRGRQTMQQTAGNNLGSETVG